MGIPLRHITLHGHDVAYRLAEADPAKPTLMLLHGIAGDSRTWKDVMPDLARDFTVLAPDLIGHGQSAKPMGDYSLGAFASGLRDLLGELEIGPVTVIGHSLGGGVAMQLGYQHPELVDRLVLIGSGGLGREVSWLLRLLTLPGAEYLMPLFFPAFVRDGGNELGKAIKDRGWSLPHVGELWRGYASLGQVEHRNAFVRTLRAVIDPGGQTINATDRLDLAAAMPTLIIWGDKDGIIPVEHAYAAHEAIPHSRLEILEGCGHFPHVQEPAHLVEIIRDFALAGAPPGRGTRPSPEARR